MTVIALANASGQLTEKHAYSAYGLESVTGANTTAYRFAGRRLDSEAGLYYNRARFYSPTLGRFLQTDPIGTADNINLYAYTGNDPVNRVDPTGRFGLVFQGGGTMEGGMGPAFGQAGGQAAGGYALLWDFSNWSFRQPLNIGFSIVQFETAGGTASAFGSNMPSWDNKNIRSLESGGVIVGSYAGWGLSARVTSANVANDLAGSAVAMSANVGAGLNTGGQLSAGSNATSFSIGIPLTGGGKGLAASMYPTNTTIVRNTVVSASNTSNASCR